MNKPYSIECELIEAEARRILPDSFHVECSQVGETEELLVRLVRGDRRGRVEISIEDYETRDWRGLICAKAAEMEDSTAEARTPPSGA